jgi:hypothetical protein
MLCGIVSDSHGGKAITILCDVIAGRDRMGTTLFRRETNSAYDYAASDNPSDIGRRYRSIEGDRNCWCSAIQPKPH